MAGVGPLFSDMSALHVGEFVPHLPPAVAMMPLDYSGGDTHFDLDSAADFFGQIPLDIPGTDSDSDSSRSESTGPEHVSLVGLTTDVAINQFADPGAVNDGMLGVVPGVMTLQSAKDAHKNTGNFPCPFLNCNRVFSRPSHLEKHKRIHTNERPHKCDRCEMAFKTKWTLKKHIRTHTGEKPFKCEEPGCNKMFTQRGSYCRHRRSHSMESAKFECDVCHKRFKQKSNFRLHVRSHESGKPFKCNICNKSFKVQRGLEKHRLTHLPSGVIRRKCSYCSKVFHCVTDGQGQSKDDLDFDAHVKQHTATMPIEELQQRQVPDMTPSWEAPSRVYNANNYNNIDIQALSAPPWQSIMQSVFSSSLVSPPLATN